MEINIVRMPHCNGLMREIATIALDRNTQRELGSAVWSDRSHQWFLAYVEDGSKINPVGMCASINKHTHQQFCHDYVVPLYRGIGVYDKLFAARMSWFACPMLCARATCTHLSIGTYLRNGFVVVRKTKNYTFVEMLGVETPTD